MAKYVEQLRRVERWYERFSKINAGQPHERDTEFLRDDVYALFQNCYHLKDWIIQDLFENKKTVVERFINDNIYMSVCADVCNGLKHLKLDREPRSGAIPEFTSAHYGLDINQQTLSAKYLIDTGTAELRVIDAFELATTCVKAARQFLGGLPATP